MNEYRKSLYDSWREDFKEDPAKAVGWRNQEALDARFQSTLDHLKHKDFDGVRILDVGCGASLNLCRYLPEEEYIYVGIDCNDASLKFASEEWNIPFNSDIDFIAPAQLIKDEYLEKVRDGFGFDVIISQGIYQEFETTRAIRDHVYELSKLLNRGGEMLIMTPANRILDAEGKSVLKISAYDAVNIMEETGLPYSVELGSLGEHIIMRCWKSEDK